MIAVKNVAKANPEILDFVLQIQRTRMNFALAHVTDLLSDERLVETLAYIEEYCEIIATKEQLLQILSLYPIVRASVAVHGCSDTQDREEVSGMIASFFLNTSWPDGTDDLTVGEFANFNTNLKIAAAKAGYGVTEREFKV